LTNGFLQAIQQDFARQLSGSNREAFIWGAGSAGRKAAAVLRANGAILSGFIDRDPAKAGSVFQGMKVYLPDELSKRPKRPKVLIASMYHREIARQLRALGFRARRDFEILPVSGADLPNRSAAPEFFSAWRVRWLASKGYVSAGKAGLPMIHEVSADFRVTFLSSAHMLRRIPAPDSEWVCVHSSMVRILRFYWHTPPKPKDLVAKVTIDPIPPSGFRSSRPFLMRLLGLGAVVPTPVICRASVARKFLSDHPSGFSLDGLDAWFRTLDAPKRASVLCEAKLPTLARAAKQIRRRRRVQTEASPIILDFVKELAKSGMPAFSADEVARDLPRLVEILAAEFGYDRYTGCRGRIERERLQIVTHERGNFFFAEIRDFLAAAWRRAGAKVVTGDQRTPRLGAPWKSIVIAPHEFDVLGNVDDSWSSANDLVVLNTEQPQTRWFSLCLPRMLQSKLVFDINWHSSLLLRALGVNAHFLPLGFDARSPETRPRALMPKRPAFKGMSRADLGLPRNGSWSHRPIDLMFVGTLSAKRAQFFATNAELFSCFRCFFHLPPSDRPITLGTPDCLTSRDMADLCRRSKIVLNLHRDAAPYCEWHRVVFQAMRQGALVVSEPMMEVPGFSAGEHFITAPVGKLASVAVQLLSTAQGRRKAARIALHAFETLRGRFDAMEIAMNSLALL
jgi:hypothetical protein